MSTYLTLDDTDYVASGVELTMGLILQASAIINGYCKRPLNVTSYTERVRLTDATTTTYPAGHLTYHPVIDIMSLKGKPKYNAITGNIFGPPTFEDVADLSVIDVNKGNGSLICGFSAFGVPYSELEVTYTSGWESVPEEIKVACGLIINQLATNANANVKQKKDFDFSVEYFGNSYISPEIAGLLSNFVLHTFR